MALNYAKRPPQRIVAMRRSVQVAFLLLNLWIGAQFYLWVRFFETDGQSLYVPRPAGVEGWLLGLASLASPMRITRDLLHRLRQVHEGVPVALPVDVLGTVRTPECNGCLTCVSVCPVANALEMRTRVRRKRVPAAAIALGVSAVFLIVVAYAKVSGQWNGSIPEAVFFELIPNAAAYAHP